MISSQRPWPLDHEAGRSDKYLTLYVQFWAPDDGRKNRLKHVERLTEINKLRNIASCWLYSGNILAMHGPMSVRSTYLCFDKLPDDGTLVSKRVAVGTCCEVFCVLLYCVLISAFCWFLKVNNIKKCTVWITQNPSHYYTVQSGSVLSATVLPFFIYYYNQTNTQLTSQQYASQQCIIFTPTCFDIFTSSSGSLYYTILYSEAII